EQYCKWDKVAFVLSGENKVNKGNTKQDNKQRLPSSSYFFPCKTGKVDRVVCRKRSACHFLNRTDGVTRRKARGSRTVNGGGIVEVESGHGLRTINATQLYELCDWRHLSVGIANVQ